MKKCLFLIGLVPSFVALFQLPGQDATEVALLEGGQELEPVQQVESSASDDTTEIQQPDEADSIASLSETVVESRPAAPAVPVPVVADRPAAPRSPLVTAGRESSPDVVIPEVPITIATRTPELVVPSVEMESVSEIRQFQRFTVLDTLRQTPGLTIDQQGGMGTVTGLRIRGMESDQNVILLNGRRLPPGLAGQYQLEFFEVSTLESVQIYRGAASSIYGSEAIGGVIDLQSTDARFVESNGLGLYAEGGSFHTYRTGGTATIRDGRVGAVIDAASVSSNGSRPQEDFENGMIRGNVAVDLMEGAWLDVLGMVQSGEVGVPGSSFPGSFLFPFYPADQRNINDSILVSPRVTLEGEQWDFSLFYSYNENELQNVDSPLFFGSNNDNLLKQIGRETEAIFNFSPTDGSTLTLGGGVYDYSFEQSPIGSRSGSQSATRGFSYDSVFGQGQIDLPFEIDAVASIRHDDHDLYRDATTYTLALEKEFPVTGTTVFAKKATGYRPPTGQDLLFIIESPFSNAPPLTEVEPEESESWEIGVRQPLFDDRGLATVTYFENNFVNGIELDPNFFTFTQIDAETSGFEASLEFQASDWIDLYTNYTYLHTEVVGASAGNIAGAPGDRLARRPRHTINAGVLFHGDHWDLGAELHSVVDRRDSVAGFNTIDPFGLEDYTVTRIFGSFDLSDSLEFYGRIENLFNEKYEFSRGYQAPGMGVYGGIRMAIGD